MQRTAGSQNVFRPSDIREYPVFYIEFLFAFTTILGAIISIVHGVDLTLPNGTSAIWQLAGSLGGVVALFVVAFAISGFTLYGLFIGGWKWRARGMFGQFILRLYIAIGTVSVFGFYPTTWLTSLFLALVAAVIWLKLKNEERKENAGH